MPRGRPPKNKSATANMNEEDDDGSLEFESDDEADQLLDFEALEEDQQNRPLITSPEWHDYVMSQFSDEELLKEKNDRGELTGKVYPSVYGLRRVAELLIGSIVENNSKFIELNNGFAIAECQLVFETNDSSKLFFNEVGNCYGPSTPEPFDSHLPSIAATRAEGRALRKALRIRTLSAEEMQGSKKGHRIEEESGSVNLETINSGAGSITSGQMAALNTTTSRERLNLEELVKYKYPTLNAASELTEIEARELLAFIHQVSAKKVDVPDFIRK